MSNRTNHLTGAANPSWKGDDVGYDALHVWVRRHKTKPAACEHCHRDDVPIEWANVSGMYWRDLADWIALCKLCHRRYDRKPTCSKGHERTPENLKVAPDGRTRCRVCANEGWRRRYYEKKAS